MTNELNEYKIFLNWADKYLMTYRFEYVCLSCRLKSPNKLNCCGGCKRYVPIERKMSDWANLSKHTSYAGDLLEKIEYHGGVFFGNRGIERSACMSDLVGVSIIGMNGELNGVDGIMNADYVLNVWEKYRDEELLRYRLM